MDVTKRIEKAKKLYKSINPSEELMNLLRDLDKAIERTWSYMREIGVTEICKACAMETGSCCKKWVEDEVDEVMILMNLLLGVKIPEKRYKENFCYFLSDRGCTLRVRPVICVTFLCDRIRSVIGEKEKELQRIAGEELELGFLIRDIIIRNLMS